MENKEHVNVQQKKGGGRPGERKGDETWILGVAKGEREILLLHLVERKRDWHGW